MWEDLGKTLVDVAYAGGGAVVLVAEQAGIRAGMGLVAVFTALLLLSIVLSVVSVKKSAKGA